MGIVITAIAFNTSFKDIALEYMSDIINGNYSSTSEFCELKGITKELFEEYKMIVEENNPSIYKKYLSLFEKNNINRIKSDNNAKNIDEICQEISELIKSGIDIGNGVFRNFDIIDYYRLLYHF